MKGKEGIVYIETAIVLITLLTIVLWFSKLYSESLHRMYHEALAIEIMMGPQKASMVYNSSAHIFEELGASTSPTMQEFVDDIGNFFTARAPDSSYALYLALVYLKIDSNKGTVKQTSIPVSTVVYSYGNSDPAECGDDATYKPMVLQYAQSKFNTLYAYSANNNHTALSDSNGGRLGVKLLDLNIKGIRTRLYESLMPFVSFIICSKPQDIPMASVVVTKHFMVPRRHTADL
ncbi:MAG: hypothetical protein D6808_00260 [Candidatus Dadabacteria bacterium]|nr:MAG: hypothetical protein D6808_00260 [Candidatus Dadabacteria bacterium]